MTGLDLNKRTLYYALYDGVTDIVDRDGYKTGEKEKHYLAPVPFRANISAARGSADVDSFGINEDYDRTITTTDMSCPIQEDTVLWIDSVPGADMASVPYNYRVVKVARSINSLQFAVKEVRKS